MQGRTGVELFNLESNEVGPKRQGKKTPAREGTSNSGAGRQGSSEGGGGWKGLAAFCSRFIGEKADEQNNGP